MDMSHVPDSTHVPLHRVHVVSRLIVQADEVYCVVLSHTVHGVADVPLQKVRVSVQLPHTVLDAAVQACTTYADVLHTVQRVATGPPLQKNPNGQSVHTESTEALHTEPRCDVGQTVQGEHTEVPHEHRLW